MKEQFVPYELALKLKELGFDEECAAMYYTETKEILKIYGVVEHKTHGAYFIQAPLWQQSFDWFRVYKNLYPDIYRTGKLFSANIEDMLMCNSLCEVVKEVTYEEARLECLKKLIELKKDSV